MAGDRSLSRSDPITVAIGRWREIVATAPCRASELSVPAQILIRPQGTNGPSSVWARMATRGSRAPIVYLGVIGLMQLLLKEGDEARYVSGHEWWSSIPERGQGSLTELHGLRGARGNAAMTTALRRLMNVGLLRFPGRESKGFGEWRRFDLLTPSGDRYYVPPAHKRTARGYNAPHTIGVPRSFWANGWLLHLPTKEIETLLALLYQRERQPGRDGEHGWFLSREQRNLLCIDTKTYGQSHRSLVRRGLLTPLDPDRYSETKLKVGLGPKQDRPHEFAINLSVLDDPPSASVDSVPSG